MIGEFAVLRSLVARKGKLIRNNQNLGGCFNGLARLGLSRTGLSTNLLPSMPVQQAI